MQCLQLQKSNRFLQQHSTVLTPATDLFCVPRPSTSAMCKLTLLCSLPLKWDIWDILQTLLYRQKNTLWERNQWIAYNYLRFCKHQNSGRIKWGPTCHKNFFTLPVKIRVISKICSLHCHTLSRTKASMHNPSAPPSQVYNCCQLQQEENIKYQNASFLQTGKHYQCSWSPHNWCSSLKYSDLTTPQSHAVPCLSQGTKPSLLLWAIGTFWGKFSNTNPSFVQLLHVYK